MWKVKKNYMSTKIQIITKENAPNRKNYYKNFNSKSKKRSSEKNKKIARTRRQRGYNWEDTLVKRFNARPNWKAFRLGSPSVALPDILVVNNVHDATVLYPGLDAGRVIPNPSPLPYGEWWCA